ncbi:MAG: hypothetical protein QOH57_2831, partial [Mycobacterium sp.]|nr:hypothetical protein [Mycobacterium sp.]
GYHACALLTGGQIQCWGLNAHGQLGDGTGTNSSMPVDVSAISDATAIATGYLHSCAPLTSGQIKCWGAQTRGELGNDSEFGSSTPVGLVGIP